MEASSAAVKDLLRDILAAKKGAVNKAELKPLLTTTATELIRLRLAARQQVEEVEQHKYKTAESKAEVDQSNLQLQNLLYEKNYYTKEIAACRTFQSKWSEEDIGLVPVEQFETEAPKQFKDGTEDKHQLQLQRLKYERYQRLEQVKVLEGVKQHKEEHDQCLGGKRKYLEDIQTQLGVLKEVATPLSNQLGLPTADRAVRQKQLAASALLPVPLYVLYHQFVGMKEAFKEAIEVSTAGSEKEAETWAQASGAEVFERMEQDPPPSKKRRKAESKARSIEPEYTAHPLSVKLHVGDVAGGPILLDFFYLPKLEVITVRAADPVQQPILASLFPEDLGVHLPNEAATQQLSESSSVDFDAGRPDRPYLWAQHLAGMDLLPALTPVGALETGGKATLAEGLVTYRKQQRIQTVLHRIRTVTAAAVSSKPTLSPLHVAEDRPTAKRPAMKRILTWDELMRERSRPTTPIAPALQGPSSGAQKATVTAAAPKPNGDSDEEGALPEEGELPGSGGS